MVAFERIKCGIEQLDETLETSLIAFRLNQETGRYQKEVILGKTAS